MRAAIAIGVRKTGGLTPLAGAIRGAKDVHDWLLREGYDAKLVTDESAPVTMDRLETTIGELVELGTVEQLVVYFAGHGFLRHYAEYWLLSKAPKSTKEAVNVPASVELARRCGIPNVVFVSDACRSTVQSLQAQAVDGAGVFPNVPDPGLSAAVDRLYAARPGEEALEVPVDGRGFDGVFTRVLMDTYDDPTPELVVRDPAAGDVIPNRRLKKYIPGALSTKLAALGVAKRQEPDLIVESDEPVHLGKANVTKLQFQHTGFVWAPSKGKAHAPASPRARPTLDDLAKAELGIDSPAPADRGALEELATRSGFRTDVAAGAAVRGRPGFETTTGLTIHGTGIAEVLGIRCRAEREGTEHIRVHPAQGAMGSVLVRFSEGGGVLLAAPTGFVAVVQVIGDQVASVSYTAAENDHYRWQGPQVEDDLRQLRATAAAAMRRGALQLGPDEAEEFANRIRVMKSVDPTLGLYAAYAYASAGNRRQVESVAEYMWYDLGGSLFDVALLAGQLDKAGRKEMVFDSRNPRIAPALPMLSRGWPLLTTSRVRVPTKLSRFRRYVRDGLWTSFDTPGMYELLAAAHKGELG